ncbi:protein DEEPER ROOTING 1-like [Humulus lupulus]|uniref:protein DEEPER ROOTING 1-like n=1 Tax=Humulus lupulus TaxID=3486 RepID=UPI002B404CAE|nr:protein DEEPER ROOTING 1-like [Humulus lupulus]
MRLFGWMQNKLNGKQTTKNTNTVPATSYAKQEPREEFSDWPQGLLSIGTFGNEHIKEITAENQQDNNNIVEENPCSAEEIFDITPEEVGKLKKELTKLLSRKPNMEKEIADLPLDRFLNCPSSLEVDRRISNALCTSDHSSSSDDYNKDEDIDKTISVILGKCREAISAGKNKKDNIGKKSISFLLKKMFVCGSGFAPTPSLRDSLQESKMEKLLRTILHKKMAPQNTYRASTAKKYLEDKPIPKKRTNDEDHQDDKRREKTDDGGKWVKTDSEYIVLEI